MPSDSTACENKKDGCLHSQKADYVVISDDIKEEIRYHIARTGIGASALLRGKKKELPKGISSSIINALISDKQKSAQNTHIEAFLSLWRTLPDYEEIMMPYTEGAKKKLRKAIKKTGHSISGLLKARDDIPEGLSVNRFYQYYKKTSQIRDIKREYYEYILKICDEAPTLPRRSKKRNLDKLPEIEKKDLARLYRYRDILGILPSRIFKNAKDKPSDLSFNMVGAWLSVKPRAKPEHVKWVLSRCEELIKEAQSPID